ncbi:predicted protein [Postia placenta Mad-698-R]|nr:predicted protein [Postia placenta Mad-698-R]
MDAYEMQSSKRMLNVQTLLTATSVPRCYVILLLGALAPTYQDLAPLLLSGQYAHSLLIVVTHEPPDIPHIVIPAVRILHLSYPLVERRGNASRLVAALDWAAQIAHDWRKYGGSGVSELAEDVSGEPHPSTFNGRHGGLDCSSAWRAPTRYSTSRLAGRSTRAFDVLINLLPDEDADDILLRQTILATAISRPYLTSPAPLGPRYNDLFGKCKLMFSSARKSSGRSQSVDIPRTHLGDLFTSAALSGPVAPAGTPHLIHLLPRATARYPRKTLQLIESMEAFLSAFACCIANEAARCCGHNAADTNASSYIMYSSTFGTALDCALSPPAVESTARLTSDPWGCEWTVADAVLSGALDSAEYAPGDAGRAMDWRNWVSGTEEIVLGPIGAQDAGRPALDIPAACRPGNSVSASEFVPTDIQQVSAQLEVQKEKPESVYSQYSASYAHSLIRPSSPTFSVAVSSSVEEAMSLRPSNPTSKIEAASATIAEGKTDVRASLQHHLSLKRVRTAIPAFKQPSAWRFGRKGKVITTEKTSGKEST